MSEKIRLKGQLKLPVVGRNPIFAQMKFVKVALSEPDILPDSGSIFTCDEQGNYDFEIYTGKHLLSYNVGNAWSKPIEIIAEPLAEGLESIEISDLIGFQEIPELDATIAALNQQKQELLAIQQDVIAKQTAVATAAASIDSTVADVEAGYPSLLAAQLSKKIYVNVATGDDTTADGTTAKPFKTIRAAVYSTPKICSLVIVLQGSSSKANAHVIDATIDLAHRFLEIQFSSNHVILADSISTVFTGGNGSVLYFSDGNGGQDQYLHANTNKTILQANGESTFHMGGYNPTIFYVSDSAKITLIQAGYTGARGVSRLTSSKLTFRNAENTATASSEVISVSQMYAGSVLVNHWSGSMGTNYKDFVTASNVSTIIGTLKAVSS